MPVYQYNKPTVIFGADGKGGIVLILHDGIDRDGKPLPDDDACPDNIYLDTARHALIGEFRGEQCLIVELDDAQIKRVNDLAAEAQANNSLCFLHAQAPNENVEKPKFAVDAHIL